MRSHKIETWTAVRIGNGPFHVQACELRTLRCYFIFLRRNDEQDCVIQWQLLVNVSSNAANLNGQRIAKEKTGHDVCAVCPIRGKDDACCWVLVDIVFEDVEYLKRAVLHAA